jgi:hypothetical protein
LPISDNWNAFDNPTPSDPTLIAHGGADQPLTIHETTSWNTILAT